MNSGGGVGTWTRSDIDYETLPYPFMEKIVETLIILLPDQNTIIINVYRPFLDKNTFLEQITSYITELRGKYPSFVS